MKNVMLLTGAGQIGMAIARRIGAGMKIVIGDKSRQHAESFAETMNRPDSMPSRSRWISLRVVRSSR